MGYSRRKSGPELRPKHFSQALDAARGLLFIADTGNNRLRLLTWTANETAASASSQRGLAPQGVRVITLAGSGARAMRGGPTFRDGSAEDAQFSFPAAIALRASSSSQPARYELYVQDLQASHH